MSGRGDPSPCCPPRYREVQEILKAPAFWIFPVIAVAVTAVVVAAIFQDAAGWALLFALGILMMLGLGLLIGAQQRLVIEVHDHDLRIVHAGPHLPAPAVFPLATIGRIDLRSAGIAGAFIPSMRPRTRMVGIRVKGFLTLHLRGIGRFHVGSRDPAALRAALEAARSEGTAG